MVVRDVLVYAMLASTALSGLQYLWKAFAVQPQTDGLEHSAHTVLADGKGFQRVGFPFDQLTPEGLAHDLSRL